MHQNESTAAPKDVVEQLRSPTVNGNPLARNLTAAAENKFLSALTQVKKQSLPNLSPWQIAIVMAVSMAATGAVSRYF
jgi:hypothetical protein